jgi:APA family basic amino acid/polyamine antiporter
MMKNKNDSEKPKLKQEMGLWDSIFLVMGSVIGSGIFMTTGFIVEFVPSPWMVMIVWILGGLITICGALSFGELASMFPQAGGQFIYLKEAYGDWSGFLFGWTFFWIIECGGIAALAVGFAEYFGYFFPSVSPQAILFKSNLLGLPYSLSAGQIVAVLAIVVLSGINYFGVKSGVFVQNIFTVLRIACLGFLIILGWLIGKKSGIQDVDQIFSSRGAFNLKFTGLALFAVLWTYDGWYSVNCTAGEIKNPRRNIPLSLLLGTMGVTLIYLLTNIIYLSALPLEKISGVARVGELAASSLFGPKAASLMAGGITIAIFGCLSATILYGPRVYYAMAEKGLFFHRMSTIHPRYHVPSLAIVGQAVWSSILCLSGTFQTLYEYVIFALVLFFAATGLAVLVLRIKQPGLDRPYRVWGYPVVPLVFIVINLAIFLNSLYSQLYQSLLGLMIILAGVPAYLYWKKKRSSEKYKLS